MNRRELARWLAGRLAELADLAPGAIDDDRPFAEYGLSSREAVQLVGELEDVLDRPVPLPLLWDHPTIRALSRALAAEATPTDLSGHEAGFAAEPIAVVGIGCRLPGGVHGPGEFWRLLTAGTDAIGTVPADRVSRFTGSSPRELDALHRLPRHAGVLVDIAGFDADFFGISPGEAAAMDPQQRLLLEVAWEALEHAAIAPAGLRGTRTGVFVGIAGTEYGQLTLGDVAGVDAWAGTGAAPSIAANRLSYALDLRGPSMALDTACSSSLVAVHLAVRSLQDGESSLALAAGANLLLAPGVTASLAGMGALSTCGRCAAFDAAADGYVRAEGVGVVVLKRLPDAERDGDRIFAVVRGSAVNQDGRSNGLTAPSGAAQQDVLRTACAAAAVDPAQVDYVEAHGTGTPLGDPIEAYALGAVYGENRPADRPLLIGSAKTNLGHLEAAAGIAGLIKVVLALHHRVIPASLHYREPNPAIPFADLQMAVAAANTAWPARDRPALAAVSAFGFGGTNAHVVLEEATESDSAPVSRPPAVRELLITAPTDDRLRAQATQMADWVTGPGAAVGLDAIAHTLARRAAGPARAVVLARDHGSLTAGLQSIGHGVADPHVVTVPGDVPHSERGGVVWVFTGLGTQWAGMGRRLLADEPAFADAVERLDSLFRGLAGFSLLDELAAGAAPDSIDRIQPLLFGLQVALAAFYRARGLRPAAVIGHSLGEVAAAVVAGAFEVEQGLRIVVERSRLLAGVVGEGAMAVAGLSAKEVEKYAEDHPGVEPVVFNAPAQTVAAGPADEVAALVDRLAGEGVPARLIRSGVAMHSPMVDPVADALGAALARMTALPPQIPFYSTVLDDPRQRPALDARYWVRHMRRPVRFTHAVNAALEDGFTAFIEISAHPALTRAILETAGHTGRPAPLVAASLQRVPDETVALRGQLAMLRLAGAVDRPASDGEVCDLPVTVWRHRPYWTPARPTTRVEDGEHPLLGGHIEVPNDDRQLWRTDLGLARLPWLADHQVGGHPLLPASCFVEMMLNAAAVALDVPVSRIVLRGLVLPEPLVLTESVLVTTVFRAGRVEVHARTAQGTWTCHARADVEVADEEPTGDVPLVDGDALGMAELRHRLRRVGQWRGPAFESVRSIRRNETGFVAEVAVPVPAGRHPRFAVHPALLDGGVQLLGATVPGGGDAGCAMPVQVGRVRVHEIPGDSAICHARPDGMNGSLRLLSPAGKVLVEVDDVVVRRFRRWEVPATLADHLVESRWTPVRLAEGRGTEPVLLVTEDPAASAHAELVSALRVAGHRVTELTLQDVLDEPATAAGRQVRHVVLAATGVGEPCSPVRVERLVLGAVLLTRALAQERIRLRLLTFGAASVEEAAADPGPAALRGLVRVLAYEHPELMATWLDLPSDSGLAHLVAELAADAPDDEVAWRDGRRYAGRLHRIPAIDSAFWRPPVRADGGYVVTGGLGGLGLTVARWLADEGAAKLVLNGRRAPDAEVRGVIDAIRACGTAVDVVTGDVAAPGVAEDLLAAAGRGAVPRGVVHAASVMDPKITARVDADLLHRVWSPKAAGAWRLHRATCDLELDWWLGFSSMAALLGWPGEPAYAAANAYVDALAGWRRNAGLAGCTVQWGPWAEVGKAARLTLTATEHLSPNEGLAALGTLTSSHRATTGLMKVGYDHLLAAHPWLRSVRFFAEVTTDRPALADPAGWGGAGALPSAPDQAVRVVRSRLRHRVADLMRLDPERLAQTVPLVTMGVDSLLAIRIRNAIQQDFGAAVPMSQLLSGVTLADIGRFVAEYLDLPAGADPLPHGAERHDVDLGEDAVPFIPPRDDAERLVAGVWETVLGTRSGVTVPFTGDGAQADRVAALLAERSGLRLNRGDWFAVPTVQHMAALLRRRGGSVDTVRVLRDGPGNPLFVVHPGGGDSWVYRRLADMLGPSVPVVGFDRIDGVTSIADRAARYVTHVLQRCPSGPFRLAGWSFGGFVAYEIATRLVASGHDVELVAMIDSACPEGPATGPRGLDEASLRHLASAVAKLYARPIPLPYAAMIDADDVRQADLLIQAIADSGAIDPQIAPAILHSQRWYHIEAMAVRRYQPPHYTGRVVLYRAMQEPPFMAVNPWLDRSDPTLGWGRWCGTNLEVVPIDGHHFALLDPPHVDTIAAHLGRVLGDANPGISGAGRRHPRPRS